MFGNEIQGISAAAAIALAVTTGFVQPAPAEEPVSTGSEYPHPVASAVPAGQTAGIKSGTAIVRRNKSQGSTEWKRPNEERGVAFGAVGGPLAPTLGGVKVLGWKGPGAQQKSGIDMTVEFHGLGVQFEEKETYGYIRADRAFSGGTRVGIQFRFRF